MNISANFFSTMLFGLCALLVANIASSEPDRNNGMQRSNLPTDEISQRKWFTDVPLIDQENREIKFYSDALKDKLVIINFIFTTCQNSCPVLSRTFSKVQDALGDRMGKQVFLISITVDPERDNPAVLKRFANEYRAKPGWSFLTGKKENIDWVTYKLGQWTENFDAHSPLIMLANVKSGKWKVVRGDATPRQLVGMLDTLGKP